MGSYDEEITKLRAIQENIRSVRNKTCDLKSNQNPRYLDLSNAIAQINRAIDDMLKEDAGS